MLQEALRYADSVKMVSSRKRGRQDIEPAEEPAEEPAAREPGLLQRIRNMWEFANLVQYIYIFGRAVKIDENLDIEVKSNPHPLPSFADHIYIR